MKLVAAKCPSCGANIEVSPNDEATKCKYCGNAILVEDALKKFEVEVRGTVQISGISSLENDLELGRQALDAKDWAKAYRVFSGAIDKKAVCYDAWNGCLCAMTQNFTYAEKLWVPINGSRGLEDVIINCLKYCNINQRNAVIAKLSDFINSHSKRVRSDIARYQFGRAVTKVFFFVSLACLLLAIILCFAFSNPGDFAIVPFLISILGLFLSFIMYATNDSSIKKYHDSLTVLVKKATEGR